MSKDTGITVSMKMSAKAAGALYMKNIANEKLIAKQAEQLKMLRKELKLSTERLDAVWSNLGSMGAKAQSDSNREALEATKPVEE